MSHRRFGTSCSWQTSIRPTCWCTWLTMTDNVKILLFIGLAGAAVSWLVMTIPELRDRGHLWSKVRRRLIGVMGVETARIALVQADLDWLAVRWWLGVRAGLSIAAGVRSEERRVGKEWRSRWAPCQLRR